MNSPYPQFAASVAITEDHQRMITQSRAQLATVKEYEIDSHETAQTVNADLRRITEAYKRLNEIRKSIVQPLDEARANAQAFFVPAIENLEAAAQHCKTLLLGWTQKLEAEHREAQRKADDEARKAQRERDAAAAATRAKAEQEAAELRRQSAEAEKKRQAAIAEGNAKAAAKAAAEAAKLAEKADTKVENAESKIAAAESAAPTSVASVAQPAKVSGFGTRKNWKARLKHSTTEQDAVRAIAAALAARPELIVLLALDMKQAHQMAKTFESSFNVPGLDASNEPIAASRAA